ncbi:hypothetical protein ES332_A05G099100v1 [Gossypium tomentosum]|uniref:Uncharacterized protein n=1 Tax=Gossypium tomentosum TaxID=34277 RepID=A0A5D2QFP4_GOSTO|nr:hypothetical protein ES332_A05G099100v1 [Gossypium tomentosum]
METKRQVGSSSSFTADLFGSKDSSSSSSKGIFSSIFPPPSSIGGKNSSGSKVLESWPKQPLEGSAWRQAPLQNKEERVEPCHLGSSLYYGGQDLYFKAKPIIMEEHKNMNKLPTLWISNRFSNTFFIIFLWKMKLEKSFICKRSCLRFCIKNTIFLLCIKVTQQKLKNKYLFPQFMQRHYSSQYSSSVSISK